MAESGKDRSGVSPSVCLSLSSRALKSDSPVAAPMRSSYVSVTLTCSCNCVPLYLFKFETHWLKSLFQFQKCTHRYNVPLLSFNAHDRQCNSISISSAVFARLKLVNNRERSRYMSNKAVIDRRLRPLCCHLGSYFKRPKSSRVVRWPATGITAHSLQPSPRRLRVHCTSAGQRHRATLAYEQI